MSPNPAQWRPSEARKPEPVARELHHYCLTASESASGVLRPARNEGRGKLFDHMRRHPSKRRFADSLFGTPALNIKPTSRSLRALICTAAKRKCGIRERLHWRYELARLWRVAAQYLDLGFQYSDGLFASLCRIHLISFYGLLAELNAFCKSFAVLVWRVCILAADIDFLV